MKTRAVIGRLKRGKPDAATKPAPKTISKRKCAARAAAPRKRAPFKPTGKSVANLRKRLAMSVAEFARAVDVSPASVQNEERSKGAIRPHAKSLAGLQRLHDGGIIARRGSRSGSRRSRFLLLDEASSALDQTNKQAVVEFIREAGELTVLSVAHDAEWLGFADRVVNLADEAGKTGDRP